MSNNIDGLLDDFIGMAGGKKKEKGLWREQPVSLMEFFSGKQFLGEKPYPGKQTQLLEDVNSMVWWKITRNERMCPPKLRDVTEVVAMFGKGCKHGSAKLVDAATGAVWSLRDLHEQGKEIVVTSLNEDTQIFEEGRASVPVKAGKGATYLITTRSGHETKVFENHVFLSRNYTGAYSGGPSKGLYRGTEWKRVIDLKNGDYVALAQRTIANGTAEMDLHELRLSGYYMGGGSVWLDDTVRLHFNNKEAETDCREILSSYGATAELKMTRENGSRTNNRSTVLSVALPLSSEGLISVVKRWGLWSNTDSLKQIPDEFFRLTERCKIEFLRALYATGGSISNGKGKRNQIGFRSESAELVRGVQLLLSTLGIFSRIYAKEGGGGQAVYHLLINDGYNLGLFCAKIEIIGKEGEQRELMVTNTVGKRKGSDIYWDTIKSIQYIGDEDYYDLTVEPCANYVSDGFIDHNSGKDFLASGILTYMAYLICCMNDPHGYFGFGQDEPIDLINVAMNAYQANNVFFKKFKARLINCRWFKRVNYSPTDAPDARPNEYQITKNQIRFYRSITAHSAHSEADSFEGFNPLIVIFDEIGGFELAKAEGCYDALRSSAVSRYNDKILLLFISYPRSAEDFMMKKFRESSNDPHVYAITGKSWEVNPRIKRESLEKDYATDPESAKMKFECVPPLYREGLFQFPEKVDESVALGKTAQCPSLIINTKITTRSLRNGEERHFIGLEMFNLHLDPSFVYYLGGDCGVEHDSYILSLFHAEPTIIETVEEGVVIQKTFNKPVEDLILEWRPSKRDRLPVDLLNVADIIEQICKQVHIKKALFDKFNSAEVVQRLMTFGVEAEDKTWSNPFQMQLYQNIKSLIYTGQVSLLDHTTGDASRINANEQLKSIKLVNGNKIDHDLDKGKDYSDARVAAVWLCSMDEPNESKHYSLPSISGAKRKSSR